MNEFFKSAFWKFPRTRLGWWAGGAFMIHTVMNYLVPVGINLIPDEWRSDNVSLISFGVLIFVFGLAAGVLGLISLIRNYEKSFLVWLAVVAGLFSLFLLVGEFLIPH